MALNYTYLKYKEEHSITNNGATFINYEVTKVNCDSQVTVQRGTIASTKTVTLSFKTDGDFQVTLSNGVDVNQSFQILYYNYLLNSLVTSAESLICGCSTCGDCQECNECQSYLSAFMKAYSFNLLNEPKYSDYLTSLMVDAKCEINETVLCSIMNERVYGTATTKDALLKIIANHYLAFYYKDLRLATDSEESTYIQEKYKFSKISKCIKKLGLFFEDPTPSLPITLVYSEVKETACCEFVNNGGTLPTTTTLPPLPGTTTTTLPTTSTTSTTTTTLPPVVQCLDGMVIETLYIHSSADLLALPLNYIHPCPELVGGHQCNGSLSEILGNGIFLGESKLNNDDGALSGDMTPLGTFICGDYNNTPSVINPNHAWDSYSRYSRIQIDAAQALDVAQVSGGTLIDFSLAYAADTYQSACASAHTSVTWVRITNLQGEVVYNGCPVGNFAQVDVCNPAN